MKYNMAFTYINLVLLSISIFISIFPETSISVDIERGFLQCFSSGLEHSNSTAEVILTQNSSSYTSLLQSSIRNLRFLNSSVPKPKLIVTPRHLGHIQRAITCSRKHGLQVRVRSGGHDYEGLSYVSDVPFLIIDLINFRSISIDINDESAWVEAGATLGELYYAIAKKSNVYGFPAGSCPTVGVGGHLSGGGFGTIFRKYGLAADNVIDAEMVDVNGNILNRTLMGEDLFWAIRDPIPVAGLEGLWNMLLEENSPILILTPYGGRMSEISGSETPFPHRNGSIYGIQYLVYWDSNEETPKHIDWMRRLYAYMAPYVSKCPRAAYLNYRDLDLGVNRGNTSYEEAKSWGLKYFKFNFERLARVKAEVDPSNFFWHEQSIPPLFN
uniref:Reticuline oxidase-like protein n=1 Tax=Cajanus cajan TaxID=3821 RepID=A0A151SB66_CAJCA|nr:Reticuline oxidase-like protein [Cajanus cajan]